MLLSIQKPVYFCPEQHFSNQVSTKTGKLSICFGFKLSIINNIPSFKNVNEMIVYTHSIGMIVNNKESSSWSEQILAYSKPLLMQFKFIKPNFDSIKTFVLTLLNTKINAHYRTKVHEQPIESLNLVLIKNCEWPNYSYIFGDSRLVVSQ